MLPKTFVANFGSQLGDFTTFHDPNNNKFDVMVERISGVFFILQLDSMLFVTFTMCV